MKNSCNYCQLADHLRLLLRDEGYSKSYSVEWEWVLQKFSTFMERNSLENYSPDIGNQLIAYIKDEICPCETRVKISKRVVAVFNRFLLGIDGRDALWADQTIPIPLPDQFQDVLDAFINTCKISGNSYDTIHYKRWICARFLRNLFDHACRSTNDITGELVQTAFLELIYPRYWDKIGPFLLFMYENGYISGDYSKLITHRKKHVPHPTVYTVNEISNVAESIDLSSDAGIRNHAIVMLLSRYGIRSRDIAALTFDNVEFENNRINFIQKKTGEAWECELFPEVKESLQRYINNVRADVSGCSQIFMTLVIPYKPLKCNAIDEAIFQVFSRSGVNTTDKRHGTRSFRSSIASNMINDDVPVEVVRNVLGHSTKHAITHYAKIDIESMRICPLPAPHPSGRFAENLFCSGGADNV